MTKNNGVPIVRFYTVVVCALAVGTILGYFAGFQSGEVDAQLDNAKFQIKNQKEVYNYDTEVDSTLPDVRDTDAWAEWLCDALPAFEC